MCNAMDDQRENQLSVYSQSIVKMWCIQVKAKYQQQARAQISGRQTQGLTRGLPPPLYI
jgi:hypothetical protein